MEQIKRNHKIDCLLRLTTIKKQVYLNKVPWRSTGRGLTLPLYDYTNNFTGDPEWMQLVCTSHCICMVDNAVYLLPLECFIEAFYWELNLLLSPFSTNCSQSRHVKANAPKWACKPFILRLKLCRCINISSILNPRATECFTISFYHSISPMWGHMPAGQTRKVSGHL